MGKYEKQFEKSIKIVRFYYNLIKISFIKNIKKVDTDKLSPTAREIMSLFASNSELDISEIVKKTGKNAETVRKSVQSLVKKGYLTKLGKTRGVSYIRKSEE